jgi:hypothetical protein
VREREEISLGKWGGRLCTGVAQEMQKGSGRWSVVSGRWSVVGGQWSVVGGQWSVDSASLRLAGSRGGCVYMH